MSYMDHIEVTGNGLTINHSNRTMSLSIGTDSTQVAAGNHTHNYANSSTNAEFTSDGGFAIKMFAGEALSLGNVVYVKQTGGTDGYVFKTPLGNDMPIGVTFSDANQNDSVLVVVSGKVKVLPETTITAARGYVIYVSSNETGRVNQSSGAPTNDHWREVGHFTAAGSGNGIATMGVLHFN